MKKLSKLFGLLLAMGTLFCLSSCDGIVGGNKDDEIGDVLEHTFVMEKPQGYNFYYYTSTTRFTYDGKESYYQISFDTAKKNWKMYTRPVASTTPSEDIASGTYTGNPAAEGELVFTSPDNTNYSQTVTVKTNSDGKLCFNGNVAAAHKKIGAKDAK